MAYASDLLFLKSKSFALSIIRLCSDLSGSPIADVLSKQVLRSATSVGAHIREGKRSRSTAEMISKAEVALQELEESIYWLELLTDSGITSRERTLEMQSLANELMAMLVAGVKRLKQRQPMR